MVRYKQCVMMTLIHFLTAWVVHGAAFVEVTDELGLTGFCASRLSAGDFNGDDYPDLFVHTDVNLAEWDVMNRMLLLIYRPAADTGHSSSGKYIDQTAESGVLANRRGTAEGRHSDLAAFADVDNDGDLDYFAGMYYHRHTFLPATGPLDFSDLFLNDGSGHFVLSADRTLSKAGPTNVSGAVFTDIDLDGCVDLWVCNWFSEYMADGMHDVYSPEILFRGNGDGSFEDISRDAGFSAPELHQPSYGASAADVDGDRFPDLFAANYCRGSSKHYRNNGDCTFTEIQEYSGYGRYVGPDQGFWNRTCSWGSMPCDFDNDGDLDLLTLLTHGDNHLFSTVLVNNGSGVFEWSFDLLNSRLNDDPDWGHHGDHCAVWLDFDNDGLWDLALAESGYDNNRLYLFRQEPDHTFRCITRESGLWIINDQNMPVNTMLAVDYDLDGDDDLIFGGGDNWPIRMFRNDSGNMNHHVSVSLTGSGNAGGSNVSAVGARVQIVAGNRTITRVIQAGDGHFSPQMPFRLNFGLGDQEIVENLRIVWPNRMGTEMEFRDLPADRHYRITEDRNNSPDPALPERSTGHLLP